MKYFVAPASSLQIAKKNSSNTANIIIKLGLTGPDITLINNAYVSGVYNSSGKKNPGMNYCEIDNKVPTLADEWLSISSTTTNQITLNLTTNLSQI